MKKKNSNLADEDDNRFSRVLQRSRHHDQSNKESPLGKPNKFHRPTMSCGSENNSSLALLFSQDAKENRPPELKESLAEKNKKKKRNIWKWRPMRSLRSHSSGDPLPCIFSVYVDSIHGLSSVMNGVHCFVKLYKKNEDNANVQSRPCRIINGNADIDETLQLHSSVTCSTKNKHGCNIWVSVCGLEMGGTAFSTHCLDLSRLVPQGPGLASSSSWATTLKLTGKTKGALLVATFACQIVRDVGGDSRNGELGQSRVCTTPQSEVHQSKSPSVSDLDLNDVPSLDSLGLEEDISLAPAAEGPKMEFADQKHVSCGESNSWVLPNTKSERPSEIPTLLLQCDTHLVSTSSELPSLNNLDSRNGGNMPALNSSCGDDDVMFSVVEQGVEVEYSAVEQGLGMETLFTGRGLQEQEIISSEKMQIGVDCDWWEGRGDTYRGFREHMQVIEEELAKLEARLDANDCWEDKLQVTENCNTEDVLKEKLALHEGHAEGSLSDKNITKSSLSVDGRWKIEEGLRERLHVNESCIVEDNLKGSQDQLLDRSWEQLEDDKEKLEETFLNEIQGYALGKQIVNCNSDEDIDSVTDEFLNLLERGHNASHAMPGREANSLCTSFQRDCELELASQSTLNSGVEVKEMQSSFMDNLEMEMQKNEQVLRSKTRAKILEDAETQALMQEWGLNENTFELSSSKSNCLAAYSGLMGNLIFSPALENGMGSIVQTRDGGYIRSMNPRHFVNSKIGGKLVMHVSKPLVMSAEMGSTAMDILRRMAATGMDNFASQAMMAMPLEDITGKTIQQVMLEGSSALEGPLHEADRMKSSGRGYSAEKSGSHLSVFSSDDTPITNRVKSGFEKEGYKSGERSLQGKSTKDFLDGYVSAEDLAPLAMQKIEALALEGLRIQSDMADEDAPFHVDSLPLVCSDYGDAEMDGAASMHMLASKQADKGTIQVGGTMPSAISFQKWMEINAKFSSEDGAHTTNAIKSDQVSLTTNAIKSDQVSLTTNAKKHDSRRKQDDSRSNCVNKTITITMLVQLRDPLRNYEPVGPPMIALIQTERVIKSPRPKLSKQVSTRTTDELEEDEVEDQKHVPTELQFKITEVHMAGLKAPKTEEKKGWFFQKWGSKKQEQSGSRWLIANGMTKNNKPGPLKSKPLPTQSKTTVVKPGETLWSISSRVHGTGSKWQEIASLNPHIRNPDIIFPNQTIRTK